MDNFNLKKYLAEGKLLKEEIQNVLSNYPKFDNNQFREFKDNLENGRTTYLFYQYD